MSEQNSLKLLYQTAQTTDDLDLFLYTGLPIVGRDGLIQIVADVIFDRLVQTCKNQKELALEMLEPSVLMQRIRQMKADFVKYILSCLGQDKEEPRVNYISSIWSNYFSVTNQETLTASAYFTQRLFEFDDVTTNVFDIYRFGENDINSFVFSETENVLLIEHTLDFINSN